MKTSSEEQPVSGGERGGVQSVQRTLDLLEAFPLHGPEIGLSQMAGLLKMNKATVYRLLSNLEQRGFVVRSAANRKYRLGFKVFELGSYFQNQLEVRRMGLHFLHEMAELSNESAFYAFKKGMKPYVSNELRASRKSIFFHCGLAVNSHCIGVERRARCWWEWMSAS
jgi:IclR family transcriptional regulator, KDG regulon repressor